MEVATLWPLSQGEIAGRRERFIDRVFGGDRPEAHRSSGDLVVRVVTGSFDVDVRLTC
jgi:hypothetical protein